QSVRKLSEAQGKAMPDSPSSGPLSAPTTRGWAWLAAAFLVLGLCTSLQIGAIYLGVVWAGMLACRVLANDPLPLRPLALSLLVPALLLELVVTVWPHLWAGFLEHAHQTPSLTAWRKPHLNELLKICRTVPGVLAIALFLPRLIITGQGQDRDGARR